MADVFISYARSTAKEANRVAEALRGLGYGVWLDDELPAHRSYAKVIEEQLKSSKAVVVVWSAEAVKSPSMARSRPCPSTASSAPISRAGPAMPRRLAGARSWQASPI